MTRKVNIPSGLAIAPHLQQTATGVVIAIMDQWLLPTSQQLLLLNISQSLYFEWKRRAPGQHKEEDYLKISCLIELNRILRLSKSTPCEVRAWLNSHHQNLASTNPLTHMIWMGLPGIHQVLEIATIESGPKPVSQAIH